MTILKRYMASNLFLQCLLMTVAVLLLYVSGLVLLVPILLPVAFYVSDFYLVSEFSKEDSGDVSNTDINEHAKILSKSSFYRYLALYIFPALCLQVFCLFAINDYASRNSDFLQLIKGGLETTWTWDVYKSLQAQILENNAVLINEYKELPVFGWRADFRGSGSEAGTVLDFPILSFFYVVNLITAFCGICVGCFFLLSFKYRTALKKIYGLLEAGDLSSDIQLFENKRAIYFVLLTVFLLFVYIFLFNFHRPSLLEFFLLTLCVSFVSMLPSYTGWALLGNPP